MSVEFILRIIFMIVFGGAAGYWGYNFSSATSADMIGYTLGFSLLGA